MKKILLLVLLSILLVGCNKTKEDVNSTTVKPTETESLTTTKAFDITPFIVSPEILEDYTQFGTLAKNKGRIENMKYIYGGRIKSANIYLPYNFDEGENFDCMFLLHPFGGSESSYIDKIDIQKLLDFMIDSETIDPMVVVMPTWNIDSTTHIPENDIYTKFPDEVAYLVDEAISRYKISESRENRICAGFSMGGITTWSVFIRHFDLFETYINMSGYMWEVSRLMDEDSEKANLELILNTIEKQENKKFTMYNYTGEKDYVKDYLLALLEKCGESEYFDFGNNVTIEVLEGAEHKDEFSAVYLMDALKTYYNKQTFKQ